MLKNYFKTAIRNLYKQKFYTLINILGLSVGIACCLLIVLFVNDELSFDKHHEKLDRLYRVYVDIKFGQMEGNMGTTPAPLAEALVQDYPEVLNAGRFRGRGSRLVKREGAEQNIKEEDIVFADHSLFDIFSFTLRSGNPETLLTEPNTMVITQRIADKYFPNEEAVGKTMVFDNRNNFKITGVIDDIPDASHFHFDFYISMEGLEEAKQPAWVSHNFHTYLVLAEGATQEDLEAKFPDMVTKYVAPQIEQFMNVEWEELGSSGMRLDYHIQPVSEIHLTTNIENEFEAPGDMRYVWLFSAIALFILLIAAINFMNLATARSANRAKEVGIRKVVGSLRGQLINQFLVESVVLSLISVSLGVIFAEIALPFFNDMAARDLSLPYMTSWFVPTLFVSVLAIGILAGAYPALFLSKFRPIEVLKGKLSGGVKSSWLRSGLVVFQFCISLILMIGTIIIYRQMNYISNKKLGFEKDNVIIIQDTYTLGDRIQSFKNELLALSEVKNISISNFLPVDGFSNNNTVFWPTGNQTEESQVLMNNWFVDHDYSETMGLTFKHGRDFSLDFPTDSSAMILNEVAMQRFGYTAEDVIGKRISTFRGMSEEGTPLSQSFTVVGVVNDFHYRSLRNNIEPLCLMIGNSTLSMTIKASTQDMAGLVSEIENKWASFSTGQPFLYTFLDDRFDRMYRAEQRFGRIFLSFSGLAILVACLGLFALAAFIAEQRNKEIGIRKVLGASVGNIMVLLSQDFVKLVLIAIVIASPLAWYGMSKWLEDFAYRIEIPFDVFVISATLAIGIALFTVSFQALRAALSNPANALKDE